MKIRSAGENALIVYLGEHIDPTTAARVRRLCQYLEGSLADVVVDLIPGYHSVVVVFDPRATSQGALRRRLQARELELARAGNDRDESRLVELPVYYGDEVAPDLARVARHNELTVDEVIRLHHRCDYLVYTIGFAPGFAYLGQLDERIATPRRDSPRLQVPAGAVAIADRQTAVYPSVSPGGWNLIGRCPTPMFDPQRQPPTAVAVGDRVRFTPITRETFLVLGGEL